MNRGFYQWETVAAILLQHALKVIVWSFSWFENSLRMLYNKWFHNSLRSFASGHTGKMAASYSRHLCTDSHVGNKGSWAFTVNSSGIIIVSMLRVKV